MKCAVFYPFKVKYAVFWKTNHKNMIRENRGSHYFLIIKNAASFYQSNVSL